MRKAKWNVLALGPILAVTFFCAQGAAAPLPGGQNPPEQAAKKEAAQSVNVYRVIYKISELENGKTVNARAYTLMAKTDSRASTRVGSSVPFGYKDSFQYHNVGMNIDCIVNEDEGKLLVHTDISMDSVPDNVAATSPEIPPVVRQLSIRDDTVATAGKPVLVGSVDDVYSNRHFEIEVTVTKAK